MRRKHHLKRATWHLSDNYQFLMSEKTTRAQRWEINVTKILCRYGRYYCNLQILSPLNTADYIMMRLICESHSVHCPLRRSRSDFSDFTEKLGLSGSRGLQDQVCVGSGRLGIEKPVQCRSIMEASSYGKHWN